MPEHQIVISVVIYFLLGFGISGFYRYMQVRPVLIIELLLIVLLWPILLATFALILFLEWRI